MAIIRLISMVSSKETGSADNECMQLPVTTLISANGNSCSNSIKIEGHRDSQRLGKARGWSQVKALLPVYLLQFCYGMNTGFPAILTPQLRENCSEFPVSQDEESWIVSIDNLATPIICILSGFLQQKYGPLRVLMFACFPYSLGWLAVSVANSVNYLYISRLLVGISHALLTTTVYTVEISSREMRGTYSLLESVLRCSGCLLIYSLGFALRWHVIAIFAPVIPLAAFASAVFLAPESPVYLLGKRRTVEAHEALFKLYGPNYRVTEEVKIIQDNLEQLRISRGRKIGYIKNLPKHPEIYKPFLIIVTLSLIQQFSGMTVLRAYVVKIFNEVFTDNAPNNLANLDGNNATEVICPLNQRNGDGSTSKEAYVSAIVIGFVRLLASLLLSKLLRNFRRRSMYFTSAAFSIASLVSFATCIILIDRSEVFRWAALATACLLVFSVQLGIQTLPHLLSGELFPSDVRAFGKGLTRSATCGLIVIGLKLYPVFEKTLQVYGTFYLFAGFLVLSLPIVYMILPETKDMGLEMIQTFFTPNKSVFYIDASEIQSEMQELNSKIQPDILSNCKHESSINNA